MLAELDRYAALTREDAYRAFELLDVQRRDLELGRAQNGRQIQSENRFDRVAPFRPEITKTTEDVMPPQPSRQQSPIPAAAFQAEHADLRSKEAGPVSRSTGVLSDHERHFDSLRKVLNAQLDLSQSEDREREIGRHPQTDDLARSH